MGPASTSNKITKLLSEVVMLESKRKINDGLSLDDWTRLRELNALVAERLRSQALREERRRDLRLPVQARVRLRLDGIPAEAGCFELSRNGLFIGVWPPLDVGTALHLDSFVIDQERYPLDVAAEVAWRNDEAGTLVADNGTGGLPVGVGVKFIHTTKATQERTDRAFDSLFDQLATGRNRKTHVNCGVRGVLMFRDDLQLLAVCQALLRRVRLDGLWTPDGPTQHGRDLLRDNGRELPAERRAVLFLVWSLWNGTCDIRGTHLWHMNGETQEAVISLWIAVQQDRKAIDEWLENEGTNAPTTGGALS